MFLLDLLTACCIICSCLLQDWPIISPDMGHEPQAVVVCGDFKLEESAKAAEDVCSTFSLLLYGDHTSDES